MTNATMKRNAKTAANEYDLSLLLGSRPPLRCFQALKLRWRLVPAMSFQKIGMRLGVGSARASQLEAKAGMILRRFILAGYRIDCLKNRGRLESSSINELPLEIRTLNTLKRLKVNSIGELVALSPCQLLAVKNFGMTSLERLRASLRVCGLDLMNCPIHGRCCASCKETGGKWVSRFNPTIGKMEQVRPWVCAQG